jgi:hypothetical protein
VEIKRGNMDRQNRAKQFMPFDALKGFREALAEKERIVVPKRDLSEEQKEELDRKLRQVRVKDIITVEFFQNREYVQLTGMVSRVDVTSRILCIVNTKIPFDDISDLQGDMIQELI